MSQLGRTELELIAQVQAEYRRLSPIPCTKCGYCLPCPNGVNIPANFELFNQATVFQGSTVALCRNLYLSLPEPQRAESCTQCHDCEELCPQQIAIPDWLERIREFVAIDK